MLLSEFVRHLIEDFEDQADVIAHRLARGTGTYEEYLIGVGRYRELVARKQSLSDRLKKRGDSDLDEDRGMDEDREEDRDEDPTGPERPPRRVPPVRRRRPRQWGGA